MLWDWLHLFTDNFSHLVRKAQGCYGSGRAYAFRQQQIGEYMYIHCRVAQSYRNTAAKAYNVIVVFKMPKSDDDPTPAEITWARCRQCIRGHNSPYCHHIVAANIGLMQVREYAHALYSHTSHSHHTCTSRNIQIRMRIIKVGAYNFGDRSWANGRLLSELPAMSTRDIALLFPGQHALRSFCGYKTKYGTVVSRYHNMYVLSTQHSY